MQLGVGSQSRGLRGLQDWAILGMGRGMEGREAKERRQTEEAREETNRQGPAQREGCRSLAQAGCELLSADGLGPGLATSSNIP